MALALRPFTPELVAAVERFNERLLAGGFDELSFPPSPVPEWLPKRSDADTLYQELFVATDGRHEVCGGYVLKHQRFRVAGEERDVGNLSLPLSEGVVDRRFPEERRRRVGAAAQQDRHSIAWVDDGILERSSERQRALGQLVVVDAQLSVRDRDAIAM